MRITWRLVAAALVSSVAIVAVAVALGVPAVTASAVAGGVLGAFAGNDLAGRILPVSG